MPATLLQLPVLRMPALRMIFVELSQCIRAAKQVLATMGCGGCHNLML
jgi:hypothetical protein